MTVSMGVHKNKKEERHKNATAIYDRDEIA